MRTLNFLIDGTQVYCSQQMTEEELMEAEEFLESHTGGNFWWVPASPQVAALPKADSYKHISVPVKPRVRWLDSLVN